MSMTDSQRSKRQRDTEANLGLEELDGTAPKAAKRPKTKEPESTNGTESTEATTLDSLLNIGIDELTAVADYQAKFAQIADFLLNKCKLHINDIPHRFVEIEFYLKGGAHQDHFTHCDEMQRSNGKWYFHRQNGKAYKAGTYKGLDLTFGSPSAFAGILIRSIENLTDQQIIEGPSLTVDHILNLNDVASIDELVSGFNLEALTKNSKLYISPCSELVAEDVFTCPRVGLTLKRNENKQENFVMKPYRFFLRPNKIKKGKQNIVLGLYVVNGLKHSEITSKSASPKKSVDKYIELFESGKSKQAKSFYGKAISTDDFCELYGATTNLSDD